MIREQNEISYPLENAKNALLIIEQDVDDWSQDATKDTIKRDMPSIQATISRAIQHEFT